MIWRFVVTILGRLDDKVDRNPIVSPRVEHRSTRDTTPDRDLTAIRRLRLSNLS
jgi:hypothetical protein